MKPYVQCDPADCAEYDPDGNLVRRLHADGDRTTEYELGYDASGNNVSTRITYSEPGRPAITRTYDAGGHLVREFGNGMDTGYEYDSGWHPVRVSTVHLNGGDMETREYRYDDRGNCTYEKRTLHSHVLYWHGNLPADPVTYSEIFREYDADGRVVRLRMPDIGKDDRTVYMRKDGRIVSVTTGVSGDSVITAGYDSSGRMESMEFPGGRRINYEYDERGNAVRISFSDGLELIREYVYADVCGEPKVIASYDTTVNHTRS